MSAIPSRRLDPRPKGGAVAFITYAREDRDFALRLAEALELKDVQVVGDWQLIEGSDFDAQLSEFQLNADTLIFVLSPESVRSLHCIRELDRATKHGQRVVPVLRRGLGDPPPQLPVSLSTPHWSFLHTENDFVAGVKALVDVVHTDTELLPEFRRLTIDNDAWLRNQRRKSFLLRGDGLAQAERWLDAATATGPGRLPKPTQGQLELIRASQAARVRTRQFAVGGGVAVILALSVVTLIAVLQRDRAVDETARANRESATAETRRKEAVDANNRAQKSAKTANEAQGKEQIAREAEADRRREAEAATLIATARQLAAEADRLRAQSDAELPLAALVAAEGLRRSPTLETDYSLRQMLEILPGAPKRLGTGLIDFSSATQDGALIAVGSSFGKGVRVFSGVDGSLVKNFPDLYRPLALDPYGAYLVASGDGGLHLYNTKDWQPRATIKTITPELTLAHSGSFLLTTGYDNDVSVWNTSTGALVRKVNHPSHVRKIFTGLSTVVSVFGKEALAARTWNLETGKPGADIAGPITAVGVDESGKRVAVADYNGLVRIFDEGGTKLWDVQHYTPVSSLSFTGPYILVVAGGQNVTTWSLNQPPDRPRISKTISLEGQAYSAALAGGSRLIVAQSRSVRGWQADREYFRIDPGQFILGLIVPNSADRLIAAVSRNHSWGMPSEQNAFLHPFPDVERSSELLLWQLRTGIESDVFETRLSVPWRRRTQASAFPGTIWIWGRPGPDAYVRDARLSTDSIISVTSSGDFVAAQAGNSVQVWNVATGKPESQIPEPSISDLSFNARGDLLAVRASNFVHVWRWKERRIWGRIEASAVPYRNQGVHGPGRTENQPAAIASLDRSRISFQPDATSIEVHLPHSKLHKISLEGMKAADSSVAISPDGGRVAIGFRNGAVDIWDSASGEKRFRFLFSSDPRLTKDQARLVGFSENGDHLLTTGGLGAGLESPISVIPLETEDVIRQVCERVGRDFTLAEWRRFLPNERCAGVCSGLAACGGGQ